MGSLTAASQIMVGQNDSPEELFELSPFAVDASQNEGYYSPNTLAGTRLRTQLKDIGTSVQVVTKEFMEDIGSVDAATLLNYTTSTETGGIQGNYSGNDASDGQFNSGESRTNPQSTQRVRGLFKADLTRNYYRTIIPFDSYNTSSVDLNRGSNATLFGLGSPAGIINNTMSAPAFENSGTFGLRLDAEGSVRTSIDLNRVLVEDKFAFRVSALKDDREYYQEPTFQNSERFYGAFHWRLLKNTSLKANMESGNIEANRPDSTSPMEAITPWLLMGQRFLDTSLATGVGRDLNAPTGIRVDMDGDGSLDDVLPININANRIYDYMQYRDGSFVNEGNWTFNTGNGLISAPTPISFPGAVRSTTGGVGQPQIWGQVVVPYDDTQSGGSLPSVGFKGQYNGNENFPGDAFSLLGDGQDPYAQFKGNNNISGFFNNYNRQGFTNLNGYDWGKNLLAGNTAEQMSDFEAYNIALEQTFWEQKAGIEVAYDYQKFENQAHNPLSLNRTYQVRIDMNARLPDGRVNPNLGRPWSLARANRSFRETELRTKRATAYVQHDFADHTDGWAKFLGKHTITGLFDENSEGVLNYSQRQTVIDPIVRRAMNVPINEYNAFTGQVFPIVYLGPSVYDYPVNSLDDIILQPPRSLDLWNEGGTVPFTFWDPGEKPGAPGKPARGNGDRAFIIENGQFVTKDIEIRPTTYAGSAGATDTTTTSTAAVIQSHFLENHLVTTVGYREDTVDNFLYNGAPVNGNNEEFIRAPFSEWSSEFNSVKADRWSYGGVFHVPAKWTGEMFQLSGHYAESSNFTLLPGRIDWNERPISDPSGDTEERGFSISTMDNKLHLRVNWFETSVSGISSNPVNLSWNSVYQRSDFFYQAAARTEDPVFAEFNRAVADTLLANQTQGEHNIVGFQKEFGADGLANGVFYTGVKSQSETEDVKSTGQEIELTWNPTRNWRLHLNVAKQETVKTNILPTTQELYERRLALMALPVPGFEFITIGEVPTGAKDDPATWVIDKENGIFGDINDPTATPDWFSIRDDIEGRATTFRTKQAAEGSLATEQRKWRYNVVTNYSFSEGKLQGASIGGAYRWQDKAAIGFPFITDSDGNTVGDIANPVFAPSESNVDLFARYKMPFFEDLGNWTLQLNVRNVFADEKDIIPVQLQGDGVTFSRYRLAPQREFILTSTFRF